MFAERRELADQVRPADLAPAHDPELELRAAIAERDPEARLHLNGKDRAAPGRKMGHVLLLDDDTDRALATAEALIARLTST
jgi:phosphoribosylaminoimidazole carboxylase (NCAIR synthetase)